MRLLTKKGAVGMPMEVLIGMILIALLMLMVAGCYNQANKRVDELEHVKCKYTIEFNNGVDIDFEKLGFVKGSFNPISQECTTIIMSEDEFEGSNKEDYVSAVMLDKMRNTWWAVGAGRFKGLWEGAGFKVKIEFGDGTKHCKPFYYFETDDLFKHLPGGSLSKEEFEFYLENRKIPVIDKTYKTLANYVSASRSNYGRDNYVYVLVDEFKDDTNYGIYVSSGRNYNALFIAEAEGAEKDIIKNANDRMPDEQKICDEIVDKDDK